MSTAMPAETLLGRAPAPLGLQIRGTERDGQVVWLNSPKVTIGSARGSTLRLCAPGIAPIHCLIVRGSHHTLARRWSPNTRYNDGGFDEAALSVGDRLGIGPLEFEVVEKPSPGRKAGDGVVRALESDVVERKAEDAGVLESKAVETTSDDLPSPGLPAGVNVDLESLRRALRHHGRLKLAQRQARRRIRKLTAELRAARLRTAELERQLTEYGDEPARRERRQAEWDQQRRVFDDERQQWLQSQAHIEQLLVELDRRRKPETIQTPPPPSGDTAVAESKIVEFQDQQHTEIAKSSAQLHADRQELDARREELIEVANGAAGEDAGQSDDVFARLRALDILKDDGAEPAVDETPASAVPEPPVADERPSPNSTIQGAAEQTAGEPRFDDEDSINEYMARLLQRVRGGNEGVATAQNDIAARVPGEPASGAALKTSSAIAESNGPSAGNEPSVRSLSEFEPRTAAPEKTRDLAAMREIANFTARTAIAKHQWRRRIAFLLKRFLLGVVALVCGIVLVVIAPSPQSREFYCGLAAIAASLVWFLPALYRAKRCKRQAEKSQQRATADYERTPKQSDDNSLNG